MKISRFEAHIKAAGPTSEDPPGTFEGLVAVFDNVDGAGDRLKSSAFDATLKAWRDSGDPIPVILSHKWDDPKAIIGHADPADVKAIPGRGLYVKGQIHINRGNDVADQVYHLMSQRLLREFSFGYTVPQGGEKRASDGAYDLSAVNLIELGPCLKGVNPETELLVVKSMRAEAPRRKSYVDVSVPNSYEERQDLLVDALRAEYEATDAAEDEADPEPPAEEASEWYSVTLVATTDSDVTYQICDEDGDSLYRRTYEIADDDTVTLGAPVDVEMAVVPKSDEGIETKVDDGSADKSLDLLIYEAAIENLEALTGSHAPATISELAPLDAELRAQLGE